MSCVAHIFTHSLYDSKWFGAEYQRIRKAPLTPSQGSVTGSELGWDESSYVSVTLVERAAYVFIGLLESNTPPSPLLVFVPALSMVTAPDMENSMKASVEQQPLNRGSRKPRNSLPSLHTSNAALLETIKALQSYSSNPALYTFISPLHCICCSKMKSQCNKWTLIHSSLHSVLIIKGILSVSPRKSCMYDLIARPPQGVMFR